MSFDATITAWAAAARQRVLEDVKWLTKDAHIAIVQATPIDTGRARSSWNIAAGENADLSVTPFLAARPQFGVHDYMVAKGASSLTRGQALSAAIGQHQVADALTAPVATISNNLDYILGLEKGASPQASPGAMFTSNVFKALDAARNIGYIPRLT